MKTLSIALIIIAHIVAGRAISSGLWIMFWIFAILCTETVPFAALNISLKNIREKIGKLKSE